MASGWQQTKAVTDNTEPQAAPHSRKEGTGQTKAAGRSGPQQQQTGR